jgi:cell division protein ZapA (FtsZ GTPase activity inhibitor)
MNESLKKQTVTIFDEVYTIVSDEPAERITCTARRVHEQIQQCAAHTDDKKRAVVLCALQLALECERLKEQLTHIQEKEDALTQLLEREVAHSSS